MPYANSDVTKQAGGPLNRLAKFPVEAGTVDVPPECDGGTGVFAWGVPVWGGAVVEMSDAVGEVDCPCILDPDA